MRILNWFRFLSVAVVLASVSVVHAQSAKVMTVSQKEIDRFDELSVQVLIGTPLERKKALNFFTSRGKLDIVPTLSFIMNVGGEQVDVIEALKVLTSEEINTWRAAVIWLEAHPEIIPHPSYRILKLRYFANIDPKFMQFFEPKFTSREKLKIRFEEIMWGGVRVDGIPSLDNPKMVPAKAADYLKDDDLVFGVSINGDARAYPLRIMGWHEMFNDVIGGVPVALAYCTLCGSGILFETAVEDRKEPFVFGSSGFLYRSNKLMFDRETNSLWNQFTGQPVGGPLVDEDIKLKIRPVVITKWANWKADNAETKVLDLNTGYRRDYGSGVVYQEYFSSPDLMFPTTVRDETKVRRKEYVYGIRDFGVSRAWPLAAFAKSPVINDALGDKKIVLLGDALSRSVRAYERGDVIFKSHANATVVDKAGVVWKQSEDSLLAPDGRKLSRIPGHISYWFAWDGYLGTASSLYSAKN